MFGGYEELAEGILTWTLEGVFVGYVMGFLVGELNDDPSVVGDIAVGACGGLAGGLLGHYFVQGGVGFAVAMGVAALGGTIVTGAWRSIMGVRTRTA